MLDLRGIGAKGEDSQEVVGYVVVKAGGIEVDMVIIMIPLQELGGTIARVAVNFRDMENAVSRRGQGDGCCCCHGGEWDGFVFDELGAKCYRPVEDLAA